MGRFVENTNPFDGLKARSETAFPRQCPACGRRFDTVEAFIVQTRAVRAGVSGLKSTHDESGRPIVELFRNCPCGSTLADRFNERRDLSEPGHRRRRLFDRLMQMLENKGLSRVQARVELLKLFRGQPGELLSRMGITVSSE